MKSILVQIVKSIFVRIYPIKLIGNESTFSKEISMLKLKVHIDNDLEIILEAEKCFKVGCLRAAYIMTWVAIIENLKEKISRLANIGSSKAKTIIQDIIEKEKLHQSTDVFIKDKIIELNLLNTSDKAKLDYFWCQRCIFVHPYNQEPRKDEVENIIRETYYLCLHRDIYFTKDMIDELKNDLINIDHMLPNDWHQSKLYAYSIIDRIPDMLHYYAYKSLHFSFSKHYEKLGDLRKTIKIRDFIIYLLEKNLNTLKKPIWGFEDRVKRFPEITIISSINKNIWQNLDDIIKEMIIRFLENDVMMEKMKIFQTLDFIMNDDIYQNRYTIVLKKQKLVLINEILGNNDFYNILVEKLYSNKYLDQNQALDFIESREGQNFIINLPKDKQFNIMYFIGLCIGNYKAATYIKEICKSKNTLHIFGLLLSTIKTSENYIYFRENEYLKYISLIDENDHNQLLNSFIFQELEKDNRYNDFKSSIDFDKLLSDIYSSSQKSIHEKIMCKLKSLNTMNNSQHL